jgi:hypothetical protein
VYSEGSSPQIPRKLGSNPGATIPGLLPNLTRTADLPYQTHLNRFRIIRTPINLSIPKAHVIFEPLDQLVDESPSAHVFRAQYHDDEALKEGLECGDTHSIKFENSLKVMFTPALLKVVQEFLCTHKEVIFDIGSI